MSVTDTAELLRQAYHNDLTDVPLLLEAADEIERLRAALAQADINLRLLVPASKAKRASLAQIDRALYGGTEATEA